MKTNKDFEIKKRFYLYNGRCLNKMHLSNKLKTLTDFTLTAKDLLQDIITIMKQ